MAITRMCEQCGAAFAPRREHARFCSAGCRVAWNRENVSDPTAEVNALAWSITAMRDATVRIHKARARDRARAFAVIGEAVWWVTIVDATLVRYHPDSYDRVLSGHTEADRLVIDQTLAGLRFVRNQMSHEAAHVHFIGTGPDDHGPPGGLVADWTWNSLPEPACGALSPQGRSWEIARYRAYQARLAGRGVGETFDRAATFLRLTTASAGDLSHARAASGMSG